jgi:hypothetical protein
VLRAHHTVSDQQCAAWVRGVYAARDAWIANFEGVQFTLGRAWYTHLEEERAGEYFAGAAESDALTEHFVPGLQARMLSLLSVLVDAPVARRPGYCGPGVHIFPAGGWLAQNGGEVHFDTEGLDPAQLERRAPALSAIVMLQPPLDGGGLRVWERRWDGSDETPDTAQSPSVTATYQTGELVAIDSYRLHCIQPFGGPVDRISATAHAVLTADGWQAWF